MAIEAVLPSAQLARLLLMAFGATSLHHNITYRIRCNRTAPQHYLSHSVQSHCTTTLLMAFAATGLHHNITYAAFGATSPHHNIT
jgi:hypothetical protein